MQSIVSTSYWLYALGEDASLTSWRPAKGTAPEPEPLEAIRSIHAADSVVCAVEISGEVHCRNDLTDWNKTGQPRGWLTLPLLDVVALGGSTYRWLKSTGENGGGPLWFAVLGDGTVRVFEIGLSGIASVRLLAGISKAKRVAVGEEHACVVVGDGAVQCWHHKDSTNSASDRVPLRPRLEKLSFTDAVFTDGSCIHRAAGPVLCLVMENSWEDGVLHDHRAQFEVRAQGIVRWRQVCDVLESGHADCAPALMLPRENIADFALGSEHSCVLTRAGTVWCQDHTNAR